MDGSNFDVIKEPKMYVVYKGKEFSSVSKCFKLFMLCCNFTHLVTSQGNSVHAPNLYILLSNGYVRCSCTIVNLLVIFV